MSAQTPHAESAAPIQVEYNGTHLRPRASSQGGIRQFNERVVLQAIRLHGAQAKAELARVTRLTAQAISLITNRLIYDGLLLKQAPVRGKVGQPSVPLALNPQGAFSLGLKIGRRNADVLLMDFAGVVRERRSHQYDFPDPDTLFDDLARHIQDIRLTLGPLDARLCGVGVAAPLSLGGWSQVLGVRPEQAARWNSINIPARIEALTHLPTEFVKDTAAACVAELVAGRGRSIPTFLYIFVDTFIGGGLVIDSQLYSGAHRNAGAVGSVPLAAASASATSGVREPVPAQLLSTASLHELERLYEAAGLDRSAASDDRALQAPWQPITHQWLDRASHDIALAVINAACLLDMEGVIIDGSFSRALLDRLMAAVDQALDGYSWEGVCRPLVMPGTIGSDARAVGGALLPLYSNFAPDRDLFLKLGQPA